eukprot:TRINITY_DN106941_c0_g1_i1.p1 TRINITY_DN106941_c0_g1~~TRINITY_DN106941_c0_g1_i1.p1  ORF type:complete len:531 (-),score=98.43 TRINITY_DN106941_c0_g1_i1:163-1713(-)
MDPALNKRIVDEEWAAALPSLQDFVRIPNFSTAFDPEWKTNGLLEKACDFMQSWVLKQGIPDLKCEIMKDEGYSPFMIIEIPGTKGSSKAATTFCMYGHLDKQPHGPGWDPDIDPVGGMIRDGKLYGRGAADDGYAVYSCIIAVKALQRQGLPHPKMIIIAETSEESGSPHLGHYLEKLQDRIGTPEAVFCLDSVVENYETMWMTTSLRGVVSGTLEVSLLREGLHSGFGGGIVPDAFRVARMLLARAEDTETGRVKIPELFTKIPLERQEQMKSLAELIPRADLNRRFAWSNGAQPMNEKDPFAMYKANAWEPCMTVVGFDGLPVPERAGNVLNSKIRLQVSFRIPPLVDHQKAAKAVQELFTKDPPYGASVTAKFEGHSAPGWNCPEFSQNLDEALSAGCAAYFNGSKVKSAGGGVTIPLMNMLSDMFPNSSLVCTGVLGPGTNMHGPNEHLPIEYTKSVTAAVAMTMSCLKTARDSWPADIPRPDTPRQPPKKKPRFCFTRPDLPVGQCLCCL